MITDIQPLEQATQARKLVTLEYSKKTDGSTVTHTVGIYEIGPHKKTGEPCIWGWDINSSDTIRCFLLSNIVSFQVLEQDFIPSNPWPIKINGAEV